MNTIFGPGHRTRRERWRNSVPRETSPTRPLGRAANATWHILGHGRDLPNRDKAPASYRRPDRGPEAEGRGPGVRPAFHFGLGRFAHHEHATNTDEPGCDLGRRCRTRKTAGGRHAEALPGA